MTAGSTAAKKPDCFFDLIEVDACIEARAVGPFIRDSKDREGKGIYKPA